MKIFIVDDSAEIRRHLVKMLSIITGVEIIGQAKDVPESIDLLKKLKADVIILDIKMPGGSGFDVLKEIKKGNRKPVIIMFTNYSSEQYRKKSLEEGANYFFDKSTEFEKMLKLIDELIKKSNKK